MENTSCKLLLLVGLCLFGSCTARGIAPQPDIKSADLGLPPDVFPKIGFGDDLGTKAHTDKPQVPPGVKHEDTSVKNNGTKPHAPEESTEKVTVTSEVRPAANGSIATEVSDMLTDTYNRTVYDDTTEDSPLLNDTVTVIGPHVVDNGKTHEEVNKTTVRSTEVTTAAAVQPTAENKTETAVKSTAVTTVTAENKTEVAAITTATVENKTDATAVTTATAENKTEAAAVTTATATITSASSVNVTQEHHNATQESGVNATQLAQNTTDTSVSTDSSTLPQDDKDRKVKTKDDNRTIKEASTSTTKSKPEATTTANISENIIEHKADMPMALAASQEHANHDHASNGKSSAFLQPTESAAILAGVFVAIALIGYVGLLAWRRILEKRYGNREMLVNEDDFYDTNDLRNFEL